MTVQTKSQVLSSVPLTVSRSKTWGSVVWAVSNTYILRKGMAAGSGCGPGWGTYRIETWKRHHRAWLTFVQVIRPFLTLALWEAACRGPGHR